MRRKYLFAGQVVLLLLVAATLYLGGDHLSQLRRPPLSYSKPEGSHGANETIPESHGAKDALAGDSPASTTDEDSPDRPESGTSSDDADAAGSPLGILSAANITRYVDVIFDSSSDVLPRLACPALTQTTRYDGLKESGNGSVAYFFAIDLRETLPLLPRLLGSVVEAIRFLGPDRCALSIVEGHSGDGTRDVLAALQPRLDALTTTYYLQSSGLDPSAGDRIARLAALRNLALQPVWEETEKYTADTTVVFLNDVAACTEDILELVHQRRVLGADMTCGMDWVYVGRDPTFYDVWVARGMTGDAFFDIPADGNWNSAWNLFWNDDAARAAYAAHRPFQVFACWNGAAVFTAAPLIDAAVRLRFRAPGAGECPQGEPQLFCKDLWMHGYGKIAVVPSVNLEYSDERARQIKELKGYTSRWTSGDEADASIEWVAEPPATVRCMPSYDKQSFRPWNETETSG